MSAPEYEKRKCVAVYYNPHKETRTFLESETGKAAYQKNGDYGEQPGAGNDNYPTQGNLQKGGHTPFPQNALQLKTYSRHNSAHSILVVYITVCLM
ncbi:hypothetical protein ES708_16085 [subsurface metagenome]